MNYDSMIFDLDGTLWDSTETSAKIFREIIKKHPDVKDTVTADQLKRLFGLPLTEIGIQLFKSVSKERAIEVVKEYCKLQGEYMVKLGGTLYPNLESTLKKLSSKYKLIIVSNCEDGYIESFFEFHGLQQYFCDYECPGRTGKLKADNIRIVMERNHLKNPVYVGDTSWDAQAAREAGVPFIFAEYGFGQVEEYADKIQQFDELLKYVAE